MRLRGFTLMLGAITLVVLALSVPGPLRDALGGGGVSFFARALELVQTGIENVADLLLAGILLDADSP